MVQVRNFRIDNLPRAASIEFPLRVNDVEKALSMVGGKDGVARVVADPDQRLDLSLRPGDVFHHPVSSRAVDVHNIVLEVEVPKDLLESVGGNVREALSRAGPRASARPVLLATTNHRFREMADFQVYTGNSKFASDMRQSLFAGDLAAISKIDIVDLDPTVEEEALHEETVDLLPPPRFSLQTQPFFYNYKQNPAISLVDDGTGAPKLVNKAPRPRLVSSILKWGDPIPSQPPKELEPAPRPPVRRCITEITELFAARPSWTRRALQALLPTDSARYLRYALPYVSYFYRSGPWRGAYIRYGVDPTADPSCAKYQVEHFRILGEEASDNTATGNSVSSIPASSSAALEESDDPASGDVKSFTFDGRVLPSSPMLQLCDISDEFLRRYIDTEELRDSVDPSDGWYMAERMAIIRRVLRAELLAARDKKTPIPGESLKKIVDEAILGQHKNHPTDTLEVAAEIDEFSDDQDNEIEPRDEP